MKNKSIFTIILAAGILTSVCMGMYYKISNNTQSSADTNVVYSKLSSEHSSADASLEKSLKEYKITGEDESLFEEKSKEILKKYYNLKDEDFENLKFRTSRLNETTINEMENKMKQSIMEAYDKGELSKEQYDQEMEYCNGGPKDTYASSKKKIQWLKHGIISALWVGDKNSYQCTFNENTKECCEVSIISWHENTETEKSLSEDEIKKIAKIYINNNQLGDLSNPKCITIRDSGGNSNKNNLVIKEWYMIYEDENEPKNHVAISVDAYSGNVT